MVETSHISIYYSWSRYVVAPFVNVVFILFQWKCIWDCTFLHKHKNTFSLYRISTLLLKVIQKLCVFARYDFYLGLLSSHFYCLAPNWYSRALCTLFSFQFSTLWKIIQPLVKSAIKSSLRWGCSSTL